MSKTTASNLEEKRIIIKPIEVLTNQLKDDYQPDNNTILEQKEDEYTKLLKEIKQAENNLAAIQSKVKAEQENWEKDKKALMETAYEDGYANGFTSGSEQGLKQYDGIIQQANEISASISKTYLEKLKQSETDIVTLAVTCAEKILKQKLVEQPDDFLHIVSAALNEIRQQDTVIVHVHPNKYDLVKRNQKELLHSLELEMNLTIILDYRLEEDDCVVEHDSGQVLAGVKPELTALRKMLLAIVAEEKK